jgi:predicted AlkP superfamily phosphohydrolase/phosphomutase
MNKVIVYGIDGGSLKLIEQWKEELPNLRRIMRNGVYGELESTVPPLTCPAWPCMFTGKNPGKLGMYDFVNFKFNEGQEPRLFNSTDWHRYAVWKILNDYGLKAGVFNVAVTFPPHEIDSFMVCGAGTPAWSRISYTYPPELEKTLDRLVNGYVVIPAAVLTVHGREKEYRELFSATLDKRIRAAEYLMSNLPWELFICTFFASDLAQHYFWHHMDPKHPRHRGNSPYKDVIKDIYKRIDEAIGKLTPKGANVLVVSDHGFGPFYGAFSLNKWLEECGYLVFKEKRQDNKAVACIRKLGDLVLPWASPRLVRAVAKALPERLARILSTLEEERDRALEMMHSIDWERTKAYNLSTTGGIFVIAKGKEYERVRSEIIDKLSRVVHPKTGEPLGLQLLRREEVYHGEYLDLAPDIAIVATNYYPATLKSGELWQEPYCSGTHALQGVFMARGPDIIANGIRLDGLKIYDIAPTILHIFGLPLPHDMDGRVLSEIFKPRSRPAKRAPVYEEVEERQKIKRRISQLKALGRI